MSLSFRDCELDNNPFALRCDARPRHAVGEGEEEQRCIGAIPRRCSGALASSATQRSVRSCLLLLFWLPLASYGQQTVEVIVQNYRYQPAVVQIKAGDTVRWVNREKRTSHSVVFSPEQGGESERFFPDESWQRQFDRPGTFPYHCGPHPEMTGVVEVIQP